MGAPQAPARRGPPDRAMGREADPRRSQAPGRIVDCVRMVCDQQICRHAGSIHWNELCRSLATTWLGWLPNSALATAADRLAAMVKTVVSAVTTTHNWALWRSSRHEVSSIPADGASWTASAASWYG